jgi:hypothetical protein
MCGNGGRRENGTWVVHMVRNMQTPVDMLAMSDTM